MAKTLIDLYFGELEKIIPYPVEVIVTGAAAGAVFGRVRPTMDIDFEIRITDEVSDNRELAFEIKPINQEEREEILSKTLEAISAKLGIDINYAEDISRWSMIDYLDYREKAVPYKKIGKINIKLMSPPYWTIGKISRYLEIDINDLIKVIKTKDLNPDTLIDLWRRALKKSPLSLKCGEFRDHIKHFVHAYGKKIWGKNFDAEHMLRKHDL